MTTTMERILHVQSSKVGDDYPTEFTITMEPGIHFDKHTTLAVYISLLEFSCLNTLVGGASVAEYTHTNIFVNCSLSNNTASFNGKPSNVLDNVVVVDEQAVIKHVNYNPIRLNASASTIGTTLSQINFWLTDDNNNKIDINTQWRAKVLLEIVEEP